MKLHGYHNWTPERRARVAAALCSDIVRTPQLTLAQIKARAFLASEVLTKSADLLDELAKTTPAILPEQHERPGSTPNLHDLGPAFSPSDNHHARRRRNS